MSAKQQTITKVFDTDRRIRLGIWGLGRGMSFYATCKFLNIDVVAGCDYNEHMRNNFLAANPGAFACADADEFLKQDFDAVLLATFFPNHAGDAIRCLRAGKHVMSEVASFFTMAEGVQLVEEVEKSGLVYNQAENYPFTEANMYLARKWREGLFGDLMYAEYEYIHECRELSYTYIDGIPCQPGNTVHSWRSWLNYHYYCTHSLGPIMVITGTRPTRVVALPGKQHVAGYLIPGPAGMGGIAPSLINMNNGSVIRNLMGATTNDSHVQRLWGTLGAAELNVGKPYDVPDFRIKSEREKYRNDHWRQEAYDHKKGAFPAGADYAVTQHFTKTMKDVINYAGMYRAYADWKKVVKDAFAPDKVVAMGEKLAFNFAALRQSYAMARRIVDAYPQSDGARVLREMLDLGREDVVMKPGFLAALRRELVALRRERGASRGKRPVLMEQAKISRLLPKAKDIRMVKPPSRALSFSPVEFDGNRMDVRPVYAGRKDQDGLVYIQGTVHMAKARRGRLLYGSDGPVKVWINGKVAGCEPEATNPCVGDQYSAPAAWKKGRNKIIFALHTNGGMAWGIIAQNVMG